MVVATMQWYDCRCINYHDGIHQNAVEYVEIPLAEAIRMSNLYPARAIGVDDRLGSVEAGKVANLAVFTKDYDVIGTVLNGEWKPN